MAQGVRAERPGSSTSCGIRLWAGAVCRGQARRCHRVVTYQGNCRRETSCQDLSLSYMDFGCSDCRSSFSSDRGAVDNRGYSTLDAVGRAMRSRCKQCNQPLIEIDHWGERLTSCQTCNRWQAS